MIDNVRWGIRWGLSGAIFLSLVASLEWLLLGGPVPSWWLYVLWSGYALFGLLAGAAAGACRPHLQRTWVVAALGFVLIVPVAVVCRPILRGFQPWTWGDTLATVFTAAAYGPTMALLIRWRYGRGDDPEA